MADNRLLWDIIQSGHFFEIWNIFAVPDKPRCSLVPLPEGFLPVFQRKWLNFPCNCWYFMAIHFQLSLLCVSPGNWWTRRFNPHKLIELCMANKSVCFRLCSLSLQTFESKHSHLLRKLSYSEAQYTVALAIRKIWHVSCLWKWEKKTVDIPLHWFMLFLARDSHSYTWPGPLANRSPVTHEQSPFYEALSARQGKRVTGPLNKNSQVWVHKPAQKLLWGVWAAQDVD